MKMESKDEGCQLCFWMFLGWFCKVIINKSCDMIKIAKSYRSIYPAIFSECLNCENVQDSIHNDGELKSKCKGRDLSYHIQSTKCGNQVTG